MKPYEESATQETEPAKDTHQAMLHGIFPLHVILQQCQQVILVSHLLGLRLRPAVWRPSRQA